MKILLVFPIITILSLTAYSQNVLNRFPSISVHLGGYGTAQRDFEKTFGSDPSLVYGGSVEFPLIGELRASGKLTYYFKSNGGYEWRQWLVYAGPKYALPILTDLAISASAGVAFTVFLETRPVVTVIGRTAGNMNPGFFAGLGAEYSLSTFPVSLFLEGDFSYLDWKFPSYTHNYGGTSLSAGVRYHFVPK